MIEILFIRRVIEGISSQLSALADVPVGEKTPFYMQISLLNEYVPLPYSFPRNEDVAGSPFFSIPLTLHLP